MALIEPPPTFAEPVIVDEKTNRGTFNPIWLKWFISLAGTVNAGGGTTLEHNSLGSIQGGTAGQYYHITQTQHTNFFESAEYFLDFGTREVAFN